MFNYNNMCVVQPWDQSMGWKFRRSQCLLCVYCVITVRLLRAYCAFTAAQRSLRYALRSKGSLPQESRLTAFPKNPDLQRSPRNPDSQQPPRIQTYSNPQESKHLHTSSYPSAPTSIPLYLRTFPLISIPTYRSTPQDALAFS